MADRLRFVTQLALIAAKLRSQGDDPAATTLDEIAKHLMDVHGDLAVLEDRRRRDRDRKADRKRERRSAESADSAESEESGEFRGIRAAPSPFSCSSPTPTRQ
ncbi:MAG TPA: hypothetical protein VFZ98_11230, partial [Vicinamibacterales bacterium]